MSSYGVNEINPIDDTVRATRDAIDYHAAPTQLSDPNLVQITRLRLLSEPGTPVWDLSYCYGVLADGTPVQVQLDQHQFAKRQRWTQIKNMCIRAGRTAAELKVWDAMSTLN